MAGPSGKRFAWTWSNYMGWTWSKAGAFRTRIWYHHCDLPGRGTPIRKVGSMMDAKSGKNSQKCRIRSQWRRHSLQNMPKVQDSAKWPSRRTGAGKSKGQAGKGLPGPARRSNPRILACEPSFRAFSRFAWSRASSSAMSIKAAVLYTELLRQKLCMALSPLLLPNESTGTFRFTLALSHLR